MAKRTRTPRSGINKEQNSTRRELVGARWQGPIPPPALIQQYNQVVDNGAERIMQMAEKAQAAEIEMGRAWVAENRRGQWLGASVSMLALVLAAALGAFGLHSGAPLGFYILPAALVSVPVFAVVRAIIRGQST
ncbi:MAG TPA: DUF2335 domain-containing protein [Stellaceae bacterium]|nr:DUF2335 domain-containing protein [Stellaceae bacterium]